MLGGLLARETFRAGLWLSGCLLSVYIVVAMVSISVPDSALGTLCSVHEVHPTPSPAHNAEMSQITAIFDRDGRNLPYRYCDHTVSRPQQSKIAVTWAL